MVTRIPASEWTRQKLNELLGQGVALLPVRRIIGRIPKLSGTGVKGMHEPDLIIDEAQDYPPKGWTEVHETVMKDHVDSTGNYDFTYSRYKWRNGILCR